MKNGYLRQRVIEISNLLLQLECNDARAVMSSPDDMKLNSCMTLFSAAAPQARVFEDVIDKYFDGTKDNRTLKMLGFSDYQETNHQMFETNYANSRTMDMEDCNTDKLRNRYPNGLHFVCGDLHGEYSTLQRLMEKIEFKPQIDSVYFVGGYNAGGDSKELLKYIAQYYQEDYNLPGFHLIRGNHERELFLQYELENLPDIIVIKEEIIELLRGSCRNGTESF